MFSENARQVWIKRIESGVSLQYGSKAARDDKLLVLIAVSHNGLDLAYASDRLKKDNEIVITAIRQNIEALQFADKDLQYQFIEGGLDLLNDFSSVSAEKIADEEKFNLLYEKLMGLIKRQEEIALEILNVKSEMISLCPDKADFVVNDLENKTKIKTK